jgi:hypothetical protein
VTSSGCADQYLKGPVFEPSRCVEKENTYFTDNQSHEDKQIDSRELASMYVYIILTVDMIVPYQLQYRVRLHK